MPALFSRLKIWKALEVIRNADLNAEFDNILNNLSPSGISGWSTTILQMQKQTSPGLFGSESLASDVAGEIERIRFQLNAIIGGPNNVWYDAPLLSISQINTLLSGGVPKNRIVGGAVRTTSLQPIHLIPGGSSNQVTVDASTLVPFQVFIDGIQYNFTTPILFTGLNTAPTTQNTFLIDDSNADLSSPTRNFGDYIAEFAPLADGTSRILNDYTLVGSSCGTNISNLAGTYQAFSYSQGGDTEYFFGYIDPATVGGGAAYIRKCFRGCFFDENSVPIPAIPMNDGDTVTLLKLAWIYLNKNGVIIVSYTNPRFSPVQPTTFAAGDLWYDTVNQKWKLSNGSSFADAEAELVGMVAVDNANVVGARSFEWYRPYNNTSTVLAEYFSTTEYRTKYDSNTANLYGSTVIFDKDSARWTTTDADSGVTLTNSNSYFLYLTETGASKISDIAPLRRFELGGYYHPHQSWRCFGIFFYDGSGNFDAYRVTPLSNLNGEFVNDKSVSVSKKRSMAALPVAPRDGFGQSQNVTFSTSSTSYVTITNLTCTIESTGRPVFVGFMNNETSSAGDINITSVNGIAAADLQFYNGATVIYTQHIQMNSGGGATTSIIMLPVGIWTIDKPAAGIQTYTVQVKATSPTSFSFDNARLIAFEI